MVNMPKTKKNVQVVSRNVKTLALTVENPCSFNLTVLHGTSRLSN